jgi:hypothetical protein
VVVEIGQQRGAGSAHRGMDIAVNPRGRHGVSSDVFVLATSASRRKCAADNPPAQGFGGRLAAQHSGSADDDARQRPEWTY